MATAALSNRKYNNQLLRDERRVQRWERRRYKFNPGGKAPTIRERPRPPYVPPEDYKMPRGGEKIASVDRTRRASLNPNR